jgi:hypothetical protein
LIYASSEKAGFVPAFLFLYPSDTALFTMVGAVMVILGVVTLFATKKWLRPGWPSVIVYGGAGVAMIVWMYLVDMPPDWFDGGREGFAIAATLLLSAFVLSGSSARTFGRPLLIAMGGTLLVLNLYAHF